MAVSTVNNYNMQLYGGPRGFQGMQGLQGNNALQDPFAQGLQGLQGSQGSIGFQAVEGPQGAQGLQGGSGPQGIQGLQGTVIGVQGAQGIQGAQGPIGAQGVQQSQNGIQGPQGVQGFRGAQGNRGIEGSVGAQGDRGPQGYEGPQTVSFGPQGITGSQGPLGPQGLSLNFLPDSFIGYALQRQILPGVETFVTYSRVNELSNEIVNDDSFGNYTIINDGWYSVTFTITISGRSIPNEPVVGSVAYIFATINGSKIAFQNGRPENPTSITSSFTAFITSRSIIRFFAYIGNVSSGFTYYTNVNTSTDRNLYQVTTQSNQRVDPYLSIKYIGNVN